MSPGTNSSESRTLAEIVGGPAIVEGNSGWPEGETVVAEMLQRCGASECLRVMEELEQHVRTMGIADRYSRIQGLGQHIDGQLPNQLLRLEAILGRGEKFTEAEHKRAALLLALAGIQNQIVTAFDKLKILRLDILATSMNDDGTYAAAPTKDPV